RGAQAPHLCAFARRLGPLALIVIVPRLYRRLLGDAGPLPLGPAVWGDTFIELPPEDRGRSELHSVFDERALQPARQGESVGVLAAEALAEFPVSLSVGGGAGER
ncbi:MAG TPA: hypothetical protein VEY89_11340, partial [Candidatus Dormibacteraeota bacterium]|nr:hypothetical protein [Candidatus Dormibacteraeota bacterium]